MDRLCVAGVKAARDVRRSYEREKLVIVSGAFAKVGVKVDRQLHEKCGWSPRRNCSRFRSRSIRS